MKNLFRINILSLGIVLSLISCNASDRGSSHADSIDSASSATVDSLDSTASVKTDTLDSTSREKVDSLKTR